MPFESGNPIPVTVTTRPAATEPAQPVYVVNGPPMFGRARRVVPVTSGPIKNSAAIPVCDAGVGTLYTDDPPISVYVVSGALGSSPLPSSTLWNGLAAYWKLDEASGVALDSGPNALHLTDNNTVEAAAGQVGGARHFTAAVVESFSIADNAFLSTGNIDFTWMGWAYFDSLVARNTILFKSPSGGTSDTEYILETNPSRLRFFIGGGGTFRIVTANTFGNLGTATWYHFACWHDSSADTVNIQINNGAVDTLATAGTVPPDTAGAFRMGTFGSSGTPMNGRLDEIRFWKRLLTPAERAEDYANGLAGRSL